VTTSTLSRIVFGNQTMVLAKITTMLHSGRSRGGNEPLRPKVRTHSSAIGFVTRNTGGARFTV
jgi:hypothetical protein